MKLRPMTMLDSHQMFEWKNYPETRKFAIVSQDEIKFDDHVNWLKDNIQYFRIILEKDKVLGAVRVKDNEISIWIDKAFWGQGLATKIIKKVSKKGFTAKIVVGNIASMRCFIKAEYLPVSYQDGYFIFQCK